MKKEINLDPDMHSNENKHVIELPDKPFVVIDSNNRWFNLNLKEIFQYRDLFYVLTVRDIKIRYKQTVLGAAWAVVQPLFTMLIFALFFGKLVGVPSDNVPYPIFAYSGLLPWTFFSNAVTNSGISLVGSSTLITKVYFPRMIIPMAAVGSGIVDFIIAFVLLVGLMIYYGVSLSVNLLIFPFLIFLTALLATGVGMWMSALNVKYRDIRYALPFVIQLLMFASPVIYPLSVVPEKWRWLMAFNPLVGQIEAYRSAVFGKPFDLYTLGLSIALTFAILIYSAYNFRRMESSFADVI